MPAGILVVIEQRENEIKAQSLQTLSKAAEMAKASGEKLSAVLIGSGINGLVDGLKSYSLSTVYTADADFLASYKNLSYADAVAKAAEAADPRLLMISATAMGKDLAPLVAAKLNCGVATDVTVIEADGDKVTLQKPIYAGKCFANMEVKKFPVVISPRPNVFADAPGAEADVETVALDVAENAHDHKAVSYQEPEVEELDVAEASIIVAGGRGIKEEANLKIVRDLADVLGAAVGASRAIVDADWIEHSHQVGQTGKTVSPNLYIALGISGAIQHLAGMSSSKRIVAINKDADAPIFKVADFGIVGDLFSVVELITEKIKNK
jgi:electron transfer flavoprotein alpha subunit